MTEKRPEVKILDVTEGSEYQRWLYTCFAMSFVKHEKRREYLVRAIPKGFHKKLLILNDEVVGQIEYVPAEASGFPIVGDNVIVMHCIWVLRKAKGHNLGKKLFHEMLENKRSASGFATLALENHWSPWMKRWQMEKLFGFKSIDSMEVRHRLKQMRECFEIHLMWLPNRSDSKPPRWDKTKLLEGVDFCLAHPLYHPAKTRQKEIFERC